jgi:hypothetical protein
MNSAQKNEMTSLKLHCGKLRHRRSPRRTAHVPHMTNDELTNSVHCGQPNTSKPFIYRNFPLVLEEREMHTQNMCKFVLNDIRS